MVMNRWDPFGEALSLREAMNRLFEQSVWQPASSEGGQRGDGSFAPALDVRETQDEYLVEASLPGVSPQDVNIEIQQGVLTIQGEIHQEQQHEPANGAQRPNGHGQREQNSSRYHLRERRFGRFFRSVTLPGTVNTDRAQANFHDGVLTLRIPKAEEMKPRRIQIQASGTAEQNRPQIGTAATSSAGSSSRTH